MAQGPDVQARRKTVMTTLVFAAMSDTVPVKVLDADPNRTRAVFLADNYIAIAESSAKVLAVTTGAMVMNPGMQLILNTTEEVWAMAYATTPNLRIAVETKSRA